MATTATTFHDAVDYKIIRESATTTTVISNVTTTPGSLYSVKMINGSSSIAYLKIFDAAAVTLGTTQPILVLPVAGSGNEVYEIPGGLPFTTLSFAATLNQNPLDTTVPSGGTVDVKLICT